MQHVQHPLLVLLGNDVHEFQPVQRIRGDIGGVSLIVGAQLLAQGIGEDLIHIDGDAQLSHFAFKVTVVRLGTLRQSRIARASSTAWAELSGVHSPGARPCDSSR